MLQHGSILLDDDQPMLDALLPADELRPAPAGTLEQALGEVPSVNAVRDALFASLTGVDGWTRHHSMVTSNSGVTCANWSASTAARNGLSGTSDPRSASATGSWCRLLTRAASVTNFRVPL